MNKTLDQVKALTQTWQEALELKELIGDDRADQLEQDAYDRLIDFVEENDLNDSEYDPRGSE